MKAYALTDVGKTRQMNQDCIFSSQQPVGKLDNLFIVADGMGGHKAGDTASRYTVETVVKVIEEAADNSVIAILNRAIGEANRRLMEKAHESEDYYGMGTTLVVATIHQNMLSVANVGDSRLYVVNEEIRQITRDHSLVEEMVSMGEIERSEARTHTSKNIITRAIGGKSGVMADFFEVRVNAGDKFLMCSDGLSNMIEDDALMRVVHGHSCEEAARLLVDMANGNGGKDNISVIIIEP